MQKSKVIPSCISIALLCLKCHIAELPLRAGLIRASYMHEYKNIYEAHVSTALNGSSAIRRFKHSDAIEIRDGITFDFYTGAATHSCQ